MALDLIPHCFTHGGHRSPVTKSIPQCVKLASRGKRRHVNLLFAGGDRKLGAEDPQHACIVTHAESLGGCGFWSLEFDS